MTKSGSVCLGFLATPTSWLLVQIADFGIGLAFATMTCMHFVSCGVVTPVFQEVCLIMES